MKDSRTTDNLMAVQHYISVVTHKIQVLNRKVVEISQKEYATSSPIALSEILVRILMHFFDELKYLSKKAESQPHEDIILRIHTIHFIVANIIPELIEAIEAADINASIVSIIEAYEKIGNNVRYGTQMIIHPTWEYNASYNEIMHILRDMIKSVGKEASKAILKGAPPHFVIITYPKAEELIVLRQALIAHEVGHFIDDVRGWSSYLVEERLFTPDDYNNVISFTQKYQEKSKGRDFQYETIQIIEKTIVPWIREIVADILAILILGPAYLFAFDEIRFAPQYIPVERLSSTHPPDQLRKMVMRDLLYKRYLLPIKALPGHKKLNNNERKLLENANRWIDTIAKVDQIGFKTVANYELPEEIVTIIFNTLKNAVGRATLLLEEDKLLSLMDDVWCCKTIDILDALKLQDLLSHGLTPTELYSDHDPSFAAMMNSGWFHFLQNEADYHYFSSKNEQSQNYDDVLDKYITLQNLIAKGIESLHFKKEFSRRRD